MLQVIKKLFKSKELIEFYSDRNEINNFAVGFIKAFSNDYVFIQAVNPYGKADGYFIGRIDDIYSLAYKTNYLESIQKQNIQIEQESDDISLKGYYSSDILQLIIDNLLQRKKIVSVSTYYDLVFYGIISNVSKKTIEFDIVTKNGIQDGHSILYVDDIKTLSYDDAECIKIQRLFSKQ